ncbi:MAG: polysaccharide pyruvyl transferase family protein [Clostridiales bacterium]|nr:polysaccharide pyruvyl transferase family protein [Clostridiales bacterium]
MKIGILTHHSINNFGAFLQGWALQEKLKALFPEDEVFIINYIIPKQNIINVGGFFRFYPGAETPVSWLNKITQPAIFAENRKKYFNLTKKVYNAQQINSLGLDCIVIGSDEVWNYLDPKGFSLIKFSDGLKCRSIVAYAPSAGKATGENAPDNVRQAMKGFTALSARDKSAQTLCQNALGVTPQLVCDPTFLTATPKVDNEKIKKLTEKPYVLFYYCNGIPHELKKKVADNARAKGYEVIGAGEYDKLYSQMSVRLTPFEWAELFRRAEYVYTGTFHGVVFSILNRKDFRVYASIDSRVKKIAALLEQFVIGDRKLTPEALSYEDDKIDYDEVYRYIDLIRDGSSDYLFRAVKGEEIKGEKINDKKQSRPEALSGAGQDSSL